MLAFLISCVYKYLSMRGIMLDLDLSWLILYLKEEVRGMSLAHGLKRPDDGSCPQTFSFKDICEQHS